MILFSHTITPRLQYILEFAGSVLQGRAIRCTSDAGIYRDYDGVRINYSAERVADREYHIVPHGLLFEKGISVQDCRTGILDGEITFFQTGGDPGFDLLASSFYLLSRYEEYLPHESDLYGRFPHAQSLAFRAGFLQTPLVNRWLGAMSGRLSAMFSPWQPLSREPVFMPTYDIDEAFAVKHKTWWRLAGASCRDFLKRDFSSIRRRWELLSGEGTDPYDSFAWMDELHRSYGLQPRYFFHVGIQRGKYDKNISPRIKAMQQLIRWHADKYEIGIHPSWRSGDEPGRLKEEIEMLRQISGKEITASRQHYIRLKLPQTYRLLLDAGIHEEFSMGYGSINGFRASVATPFYWYDLEEDKATSLLVHPFCYMEANSFFEQGMTATQALEEMQRLYAEVKKVNGTMLLIWHNTFLGTAPRFEGWRDAYQAFVKLASSPC